MKHIFTTVLILMLSIHSIFAAPISKTASVEILESLITELSKGRIPSPFVLAAIISEECKKYTLDPLLVLALIEKESHFRPHAKSHKGALGLMQLLPSTGKEVADKLQWVSFSKKDLLNPYKNVILGIAYLAKLKKRFNHDRTLFLTAYNNGVSRLLKLKRNPAASLHFLYAKGVLKKYKYLKIRLGGLQFERQPAKV